MPGVSPSARLQWSVAAAQAVTFLITDLAGIAIEMKWHKMDFLRFMPTRPWRVMFFLGWLQLLGNIRSERHLHPPGLCQCLQIARALLHISLMTHVTPVTSHGASASCIRVEQGDELSCHMLCSHQTNARGGFGF